MSDQQKASFVHQEPVCAFCGHALAPNDRVASIRVPSHARGFRYFGAHAECCRQAVRPELAALLDVADVPPGLDHFLLLPA